MQKEDSSATQHKTMPRNIFKVSKVRFLVFFFFLLTSILIVYFFLPKVIKKENNNDVSINDSDSVFQSVDVIPDDIFDEYGKSLEGDWHGYFKNWNWEENIIFAHIKGIDKQNMEFTVVVSAPDTVPFSNKEILVSVKCPNTKTVAIGPSHPVGQDPEILDSNFDIFEKAKLEDTLITHCLEEECINIGKTCILISR